MLNVAHSRCAAEIESDGHEENAAVQTNDYNKMRVFIVHSLTTTPGRPLIQIGRNNERRNDADETHYRLHAYVIEHWMLRTFHLLIARRSTYLSFHFFAENWVAVGRIYCMKVSIMYLSLLLLCITQSQRFCFGVRKQKKKKKKKNRPSLSLPPSTQSFRYDSHAMNIHFCLCTGFVVWFNWIYANSIYLRIHRMWPLPLLLIALYCIKLLIALTNYAFPWNNAIFVTL